jgi:hypothetical protein
VQGRHYVRRLKGELLAEPRSLDIPASFADHALFYSVFPERLAATVLGRPTQPAMDEPPGEGFAELADRLGAERPVLFRILTPPGVAAERLGWQLCVC